MTRSLTQHLCLLLLQLLQLLLVVVVVVGFFSLCFFAGASFRCFLFCWLASFRCFFCFSDRLLQSVLK